MLVKEMGGMTLPIPAELKKRMARHPEVKWPEVARAAILRQLDGLEQAEKIASKSRLTESDVHELAAKADAGMARHFGEIAHATRNRR